jgi:hypothetical protein
MLNILIMKTKFNKESRNLLIGLLLGDGTISNNYVFKLSHGYKQKEYIEWKIQRLNDHGIKNNGLKSYISIKGYNVGKTVYYSQLSVKPFIKVLRRVFYKPKKIIGNRKMLNRLTAEGIAILYMDDGHINFRRTKNKVNGFYIKISLCEPKEQVQVFIDYFKEKWGINFYMFHEGRKKESYSLCCGTVEGIKFINLVKPYVNRIPSMAYKIQYDLSQRTHTLSSPRGRNTKQVEILEDIV